MGPDTTAARLPRKRVSVFRLYYRRFVRNRPAVVGVFVFIALALFAIIGPHAVGARDRLRAHGPRLRVGPHLVAKYDIVYLDFLAIVYLDFLALGTPPEGKHWFGTTPPATTSLRRPPLDSNAP